MAEAKTDAARWESLRVAFTVMMWAFLFFLPLPIPGLKAPLDIFAWALLLIAVGSAARHVPVAGRLWVTAAAGPALWAVRLLTQRGEPAGSALVLMALYLAMWALVEAFVWQLGSLIARLATDAGADDVAATARWRRWLPLVPLVLFAGNWLVPAGAKFLFGCVYIVVTACVISLLMGMPAGAARMCAHAASQASTGGADGASR